MAARSIFSIIALILVAAGLLFEFFILLAGTPAGNPVNRWYFLQADTSNIPGAPALSRWTFWNVCDGTTGHDVCTGSVGKTSPARPLDPPRNFGTTQGVPQTFIGTHYYYYMTRFMFAFMLISVFFSTMTLFTGILAMCSRLGAYISSFMATIAWFFQALTASLMTAAYIRGRNAFRANGQAAQVGSYAFGFEWAAFVCFFLAMILFCIAGSSKDSGDYSKKRGGFFKGKRSKSTRSRGSFINGDKDYA